jgi:VIT1/CCC1 family predicted Fe2+/Mn2+ transporter
MEESIKTGMAFGLTSGIITTLGLIVGLHSGTHSGAVVIGGVITISVADALSDALGIHVSEEAENVHTEMEVWMSTLTTFLSKFFCSLSFLVPLLFLQLQTAIWVSVFWGLGLLALLSFWIARSQRKRSFPIISEHLLVAIVVIAITHALGDFVSGWTGVMLP